MLTSLPLLRGHLHEKAVWTPLSPAMVFVLLVTTLYSSAAAPGFPLVVPASVHFSNALFVVPEASARVLAMQRRQLSRLSLGESVIIMRSLWGKCTWSRTLCVARCAGVSSPELKPLAPRKLCQ